MHFLRDHFFGLAKYGNEMTKTTNLESKLDSKPKKTKVQWFCKTLNTTGRGGHGTFKMYRGTGICLKSTVGNGTIFKKYGGTGTRCGTF